MNLGSQNSLVWSWDSPVNPCCSRLCWQMERIPATHNTQTSQKDSASHRQPVISIGWCFLEWDLIDTSLNRRVPQEEAGLKAFSRGLCLLYGKYTPRRYPQSINPVMRPSIFHTAYLVECYRVKPNANWLWGVRGGSQRAAHAARGKNSPFAPGESRSCTISEKIFLLSITNLRRQSDKKLH